MGWFGRKQPSATPAAAPVTDAATGIDFSSYELAALSNDVRSIIDVPGAVAQTAKWAFGIPLLVGAVSWIGFSGRMSNLALVAFVFGAMVLSFAAGVVIGGYFVVRKRLDTVADASRRVVAVMGEMHADVVRIRDGRADTSVHEVAVGLLENAVFPLVFDTLTGTAESALGPLGIVAERAARAPRKLVQRSVISAVGALPDRKLGQLLRDSTNAMPVAADLVTAVNGEYQRVRDNIEGIVAKVSRTTLASVLGLAVVSMIPLVIWVVIGIVAT